MQNNNDIAKAFFELWQKQLEATMKDPAVVENMLSVMLELQKNYISANEMMEKAGVVKSGKTGNNPSYDAEFFKSFTPAGFNIPGSGNDDSRNIAASLAALEKRLTEIERKLSSAGNGKKPAARNSGKTRKRSKK